jgi:hypothetical protein
METIRTIATQYQAIQKNKKSYGWYTNVYENITHELKCMNFVEKHYERVEAALDTYIEESRKKPTFLREWLVHGLHQITQYIYNSHLIMTPDIKEVWPMFFEETPFEDYDISYDSACDTLNKMKDKLQMRHCDDEEILAIHKNKRCDCMYMCSYCEEMESQWKKKVHDMFSSPRHIFLRPALQDEFIEKWLAANKTYSAYQWPPTKVYYQGDVYKRYSITTITDFAEMCNFIKNNREQYKQEGKTPLQCHDELSRDIQYLFGSIRPNQSDIAIFIKLWNKIDIVPIWLNYDKARCKEILEML